MENEFKLVHILDWYDRPISYIASIGPRLYYGECVSMDTDKEDIELLIEVSHKRAFNIIHDLVTLRQAQMFPDRKSILKTAEGDEVLTSYSLLPAFDLSRMVGVTREQALAERTEWMPGGYSRRMHKKIGALISLKQRHRRRTAGK